MIRHDAAPPTSAAPPYYGYGYGAAHDEPVDARTLTKIVRRHRLLISGTILAISGMATLLAFNLTPRYTGVASVTIDPRQRAWSTPKRSWRSGRRIAGPSRRI
jgi:uncharacterized protein involved in exopolysaccharide biosynthesis